MKVKVVCYIAVLALLFAVFVGLWISIFAAPSDPHNLSYFLWKHGFLGLSHSKIYAGMVNDRRRETLVLGKSKEEINTRLGPLRNPLEASPYLRSYYEHGPYKGQDAAYLDDSILLIVFEGGRATDMVIVKGW